MNKLSEYILRILISAILVSLIKNLVGQKTTCGKLITMLGGIFITVNMISPLLKIEFHQVSDYINNISIDADAVVAEGEDMALSSLADIIKSKTEAYILDKAAFLELNLEVEVTLNNANPPIPCSVELRGSASPHAKKQLREYIADELGISEDNQTWI